MIYWIIGIYVVLINVVAFAMYGIDKKKAERHEWRISEAKLIGVAAIGGSIGAIFGMKCFRHKTKHIKFTFGVPAIIILQVVLVVAIVYIKLKYL